MKKDHASGMMTKGGGGTGGAMKLSMETPNLGGNGGEPEKLDPFLGIFDLEDGIPVDVSS